LADFPQLQPGSKRKRSQGITKRSFVGIVGASFQFDRTSTYLHHGRASHTWRGAGMPGTSVSAGQLDRSLLARRDSSWGARATRNPHHLRRANCFVYRQCQLNLESANPPHFGNKEVEVGRVLLQPGYLQLE
jgi:hypothetical protein